MYRYRLIDGETGTDIGPLISPRVTFALGEEIIRRRGERYVVTALVEPETETFRAYIVVRRPYREVAANLAEVERHIEDLSSSS
jgi:hypothetical protein